MVDCATKMSSDRFIKEKADCFVQTSKINILEKSRPCTAIVKKKRKTSKKTYNMMGSAVTKPEQLNGRRFVIYSKDEYQTFIDTKSGKPAPNVVVVNSRAQLPSRKSVK